MDNQQIKWDLRTDKEKKTLEKRVLVAHTVFYGAIFIYFFI